MQDIVDFTSLLSAARAQRQPQRLLFLFLRTELPDDHDADQAKRFQRGQGGALTPVMRVSRGPDELESFAALAEESRHMGQSWQMVLVAALPGRGGRAPSEEEAEEALKAMVKAVHAGGDLSPYLAFDTAGELLRFVQ